MSRNEPCRSAVLPRGAPRAESGPMAPPGPRPTRSGRSRPARRPRGASEGRGPLDAERQGPPGSAPRESRAARRAGPGDATDGGRRPTRLLLRLNAPCCASCCALLRLVAPCCAPGARPTRGGDGRGASARAERVPIDGFEGRQSTGSRAERVEPGSRPRVEPSALVRGPRESNPALGRVRLSRPSSSPVGVQDHEKIREAIENFASLCYGPARPGSALGPRRVLLASLGRESNPALGPRRVLLTSLGRESNPALGPRRGPRRVLLASLGRTDSRAKHAVTGRAGSRVEPDSRPSNPLGPRTLSALEPGSRPRVESCRRPSNPSGDEAPRRGPRESHLTTPERVRGSPSRPATGRGGDRRGSSRVPLDDPRPACLGGRDPSGDVTRRGT